MMNPITLIDGYKFSHKNQYPEGTMRVYSNWTPRSSRVPGQDEVVFFGLQYLLQRYLMDKMEKDFFARSRHLVEKEYTRRLSGYLGPNDVGTKHIAALHELGYIPLEFRALSEGKLCPLRCAALTVENTVDEFFWLTNYIETLLSAVLWLPCTSATSAYRLRKLLNAHAIATGGNREFVQWQGHDFSMRGMAGIEAAMLSGAGHLLSFTGTDTVPALDFIENYYGPTNGDLIGGSVPATEHSVMSCGGCEGELETFDRLLALYPSGILSVVSDTWDLWHVLTIILPVMKDRIMAREGKLVIRPDSGDPADILCGDSSYHDSLPRNKGVVQLLWDIFGGTTNEKGFKELDPHIGVIYGDSINYERAQEICQRLAAKGFASTNVVFGIGSYTYQYCTRDTYGFAMKATWAKVNGEGRDLFKKPVTDSGEKNSATGRLAVLYRRPGSLQIEMVERATLVQEADSLLRPVWKNGAFISRQSFSNVRDNLWSGKLGPELQPA